MVTREETVFPGEYSVRTGRIKHSRQEHPDLVAARDFIAESASDLDDEGYGTIIEMVVPSEDTAHAAVRRLRTAADELGHGLAANVSESDIEGQWVVEAAVKPKRAGGRTKKGA